MGQKNLHNSLHSTDLLKFGSLLTFKRAKISVFFRPLRLAKELGDPCCGFSSKFCKGLSYFFPVFLVFSSTILFFFVTHLTNIWRKKIQMWPVLWVIICNWTKNRFLPFSVLAFSPLPHFWASLSWNGLACSAR